jgi:SecD/SecF fusion protein
MNLKIYTAFCFLILIGYSCSNDAKRSEAIKITFEISQSDAIKSLSSDNSLEELDSIFRYINRLPEKNNSDFLNTFESVFNDLFPNDRLSRFFYTVEFREKIDYNTSNQEVVDCIKGELIKLERLITKQIQKRLKKSKIKSVEFQPEGNFRYSINCQKKDKERIIRLIRNRGKFEIFENFNFDEIYPNLLEANKKVYKIVNLNGLNNAFPGDAKIDSIYDIASKTIQNDEYNEYGSDEKQEEFSDNNLKFVFDSPYFPIFEICRPDYKEDPGFMKKPLFGISKAEDILKVNNYLSISGNELPRDAKFYWNSKPVSNSQNVQKLFIIRVTSRDGRAVIENDGILKIFKPTGRTIIIIFDGNMPVYQRFRRETIGKYFSIVIDDKIYIVSQVKKENKKGIIKLNLKNYSKEEVTDLKNMIQYNFPADLIQIINIQ